MIMLKFNEVTKLAPNMPGDLASQAGRWNLVSMALEAVQAVAEQASDRDSTAGQVLKPRHRLMLTLLAYCYATGLYGSEDVEMAARQDRVVRYLCANERMTSNELRGFRRQHRSLLRQTLAFLLQLALRYGQLANPPTSFHLSGMALSLAQDTVPQIEWEHCLREADRRMLQAIEIDSMTLDE